MATYNTYEDGKSSISNSMAAASVPAVTTLENTYDATKRPLTAADVLELIQIPAGTFVHKVFFEVLNGEAATTLDIGDGTDVDGYVATADVSTTGTKGVGGGTLAGGKFYAAADTIDVEVPATMAFTTLKVRVVAMVTMIG